MLYPLDEAPDSSFCSSVVHFLLLISAPPSDRSEAPIPSTMEDVPPDPPPPTTPPDPPPRHPPQPTAQSALPTSVTHLAWNCRGSGGSLRSPTMNHLARLLVSTRAQVCFLSETRNASITNTSITNRFNYNDAFVVPAQGQSGGLWLLWNDEVDLNVMDHSHHFIFALCTNKSTSRQYGLVCLYGDPHHILTTSIFLPLFFSNLQ